MTAALNLVRLICTGFIITGCMCAFGQPGLRFVENKNQWPADVHFGARVPAGNLFVHADGFSIFIYDGETLERYHDGYYPISEATGDILPGLEINAQYLRVRFQGANHQAAFAPYAKLDTYYNFFVGSDTAKWSSRAAAYEGIRYEGIYDGVDLRVYSQGENLKYDFIVAPEKDASCIAIDYDGAGSVREEGHDVRLTTTVGDLIEKQPVVFQDIDGQKCYVPCSYVLDGTTLRFTFPEGYDPCYELIIDPLLIFSTYSGSAADNWGSTATPGEHGNLYSSGVTNHFAGNNYSGTFPATPGAFQTSYGGIYDVAILKYDSTGQHLLYASYLGGSESESPHSLVMNSNNELIVLGTTSSSNFPTTLNAYDRDFNGGTAAGHVVGYNQGSDIFVSRISADGSVLLGSTYVGGLLNDGLNPSNGMLTRNYGDQLRGDIITDSVGDIYVSSVTASQDFPVPNGYDTAYNGGVTDAVLFKLSRDLSELAWGTFIGGSGADASHTLKLADSLIFIGGGTTSTDFPVTAGCYQTTLAGNADGWMARMSIDGTAIQKCTFTGTTSFDQVYFIDLNSNNDVYVYGQTAGDFPMTPGVYGVPNSGQFIQKFNSDLTGPPVFSTVFGSGNGTPDISPTAFLVNECNNLYMAGWGGIVNSAFGYWNSSTNGMPVSQDAYQKTTSGSDFYFMVLTDDAQRFLYGTYLGGPFSRTHIDGGTCRFDKSGIVYHAVCSGCRVANETGGPSSDFPTTPGAWSRVNGSINCNNAAFKFDLSSLKARIQTNTVDLKSPGVRAICLPDSVVFQNHSTGGEIFEWDLGDGTQVTRYDSVRFIHTYEAEGTYRIKLIAYDANTCAAVDSTATSLSIYDLHPTVQDDDDVCEGSPYHLKASADGSFIWMNDAGAIVGDSPEVVVLPKDTTKYIVEITAPTGCVRRDSVTLNVIPAVEPEFKVERTRACFGLPALHLTNLTETKEGESFSWDFGDGSGADEEEPVHAYTRDSVYRVRLIGSRESCEYSKESEVPVFTLKVPNVITPGPAEGINDTFIVQYGQQRGVSPPDYGFGVNVTVFDRWGGVVFTSKDYHNDWSADNVAAGVYYYEVTVKDHGTCKSWLQVVK